MKRHLIFLPLLAALLTIGAMTAVAPPESIDHCFARWVWVTEPTGSFWQAPYPDKAIGLLDLRSRTKSAQKDGLAGWGLFVYNVNMAGTPGLFCYGGDFTATLDGTDKGTIEILLGATLDSTNVRDILWERLTIKADPLGLTGPKPIMPGHDLVMELHLGGHSLVKSVKLVPGVSPEWANVQKVLQEDYRKIRLEALKGKGKDKDHHRRVLQAWKEKYGIEDHEQFIPADLPKEKPLAHSTTITESWNCADSDSLTCDLVWVEQSGDIDIVSNKASQTGTTYSRARAASDLSSDDHYAEVDISTNGALGGNQGSRVHVRHASNADQTYYMAQANWAGGNEFFARKFVLGTETDLSPPRITFAFDRANTYRIKIEIDGSSGEIFVDDVSQDTFTDTDITGNVRTGISGQAAQTIRWDVLEAADLAAAAARRIVIASKIGVAP